MTHVYTIKSDPMGSKIIKTDGKEYYTISEAAKVLDVSPSTVWRWIKTGKLPAYRVGERSIRIKREAFKTVISPVRPKTSYEMSSR